MSLSPEDRPVEWVTVAIIRQLFREQGYLKRLMSGELVARIAKSRHPHHPPKGEPHCTQSQALFYYSADGKPRAVVHQYLRPDGTIGASGLPDPKRLFLDDRIVSVRSPPRSE